jgi:putative membrane protein
MGLVFKINHYLTKCAPGISENEKNARVRNRRVHMANERTFLAWIRTSIGIMAFGFVVEKCGLFVRQFSYFIAQSSVQKNTVPPAPSPGYSSVFGVVLIALGALMGLLSFIRYKKVEWQIDQDTYQPSLLLDVMLVLSIFAIGIFLVIYIIHSI